MIVSVAFDVIWFGFHINVYPQIHKSYIYMYIMCIWIYINPYVCTSNFWHIYARSSLSILPKRFPILTSVQLPIFLITHQSSISRPPVKTRVQSPTAYTLLYTWENLNIALDLCYYQLTHGNIHDRAFDFLASCSPLGGRVYIGAKPLILLSSLEV